MKNFFPVVLKAGLITGSLDILSAFIHYYLKTWQTQFLQVFKFIASGIFGKEAFSGSTGMVFWGIFLHYVIAFIFCCFFFWIYASVSFVRKNWVLSGILYGIFVWALMNLVIVPMSNVAPRPFRLTNALINVGILIIAMGLPVAFMANKNHKLRIDRT